MSIPQTVTRDELYEQVWSQPLSKLAPRYGLSDVGMAKICRKHQIPRPPVGHWARQSAGKATVRPPLPELNDDDLNEIRFFRKQFDANVRTDIPDPEVVVTERLTSPHRLVDQTRTGLRDCEKSERGILLGNSAKHLNLLVTRTTLSRSLRIFDAIIKHWESVDGSVSADAGQTLIGFASSMGIRSRSSDANGLSE